VDVEHFVLAAVIVLGAALVIGIAAERVRVPYIVALLIVSLPFGPFGTEQDFVHSILLLLLPVLIFEAAWHFHARGLLTEWPIVAFMAAPNVVITMFVIGGGLAALHLMPFLPALLLGVIVAPTDPVAVIATFKQLKVPQSLAVAVEGESLFNDGVGVVVYGALAYAVASGSAVDPWRITGSVILVSLGGALAGALVAAVIFAVARFAMERDLHVIATLVSAYGAYLLAEHFHVSGIFAALAAGIAYRILQDRFGRKNVVDNVDSFWGIAGFFANTLIFLIVGARIEIGRVGEAWPAVIATVLLVWIARAIVVYLVLPRLGLAKRSWQHVVMISGIRGGVSIALALALPEATPYRDIIIDVVYGVVAATVLIQGTALGPVLKRLDL
jgi:CPA1 family monovalent cation:H+ antiporter